MILPHLSKKSNRKTPIKYIKKQRRGFLVGSIDRPLIEINNYKIIVILPLLCQYRFCHNPSMQHDHLQQQPPLPECKKEALKEETTEEESEMWFDEGISDREEEQGEDEETQKKQQETVQAQNNSQPTDIKETNKKGHHFDRTGIDDKYQDLQTFEHNIDSNYLILMAVLNKHRIVNFKAIAQLKIGYLDFNIASSILAVKTTDEKEASRVIEKISDFLDRLSVIKIDIRPEVVNKFVHFDQITAYFRKDKIVLFANGSKDTRSLYIGGNMKSSELRNHIQRIKAIRVSRITLRALRNTRSYKIIVGEILGMEHMQKELQRLNQVNFAEIDRRNKSKELSISIGTISKKDLTGNDYQDFIMRQLRKYFILTVCYARSENYLPLPKCENVAFRFAHEKYVKKSFMYIIALRQDFYEKREEIYRQLQNFKERIIGVRFFYHLSPVSHDFIFDRQKYYYFRFPVNRPYSISFGVRSRTGGAFNLKAFYERVVELLQDRCGNRIIS